MASTKKPVRHSDEEDGKKVAKNAEWPIEAVAILLDIYVKKFAAGRGYLRGNDWEEVTVKVNEECEPLKICKTVKQCRDKVDSLKRRYKMEKRKVVNGNEVTWPFFTKLDEMMGSVFKQTRELESQHRASLCYSNGDGAEEEDGKLESSGFRDEEYYGLERQYGNTPSYLNILENGKARVLERDTLYEDGYNVHRWQCASLQPQLSADNSRSSGKIRLSPCPPQPCAARKSHPGKRKIESEQHPMQALADAITRFSEVYARVELEKLEILTSMKLELAKLRRKRHKNSSRSEQAHSSSTTSG